MTATIHWTPIGLGTALETGAPSTFIDTMERVFGRLPVRLSGESDCNQLRVLSKLYDIPEGPHPYADLIDAVEESGAIRVEATY